MNIRVKRFFPLFTIIFIMLSPMLISQVLADPAAILKVSLPEGAYIGYNSDPWLSECWLLNLTGASQTFILRINDTSKSVRSYDTRLIIALNDEGYNNLETLIINGTQVPKSAFKYGTPTPYNIWTWPSGDVYPTWFNDTLVNVGTIERKGYVDLIVSITVSNATNVRIHFDAYGSKVSPPPPTKVGDITHNGLSEDSTVLLQPGPPPPQRPIASFYYTPQYPETNETVTFNATESYDPDGYIVSYTWDFGDGTPNVTTSDPVTNHTYTTFGDYTVTLTVTDNSGLTGEAASSIHISQHPIASFTFTPTDPLAHETVTFDASSSTPDGGTIVSYTWNFGDGNTTTVSDPIITHAYSTYGTYTVTLNVTDSEGKWDTTSKQITVAGLPIADFWWTPYYPQRGENVTFDASTSTPDGGAIISYAWDFGDGNTTSTSNPITMHTYAATGDYIVTLNVTDSEGKWDTETKTITVVPIRYYLEVKTEPLGITTIPGENWYNESVEVTLTAPDTVQVSTGIRYKFTYWTVDDASQGEGINQITVLMDKNHTAIAHYKTQYYLTVKTDPAGITTIPGEGWYDNSTNVSLNAPTVVNYQFSYWDIDGASQGSGINPITV
ncbi:MAG: PKD domain-containing protein, partial [Candidatus Bathyarchaeales archaeon]